jgi:uncharacterized protein
VRGGAVKARRSRREEARETHPPGTIHLAQRAGEFCTTLIEVVSDRAEPPGVCGMTEHDQQELPAGSFSSWLRRTLAALLEDSAADVPCGECDACCRSSYFIHVGPEETQTLSRIPRELLFPAAGLPPGNVVLGYDEDGRCPMLKPGGCAIYESRSLTCRTYDCRVSAAAGTAADRPAITRQARRWKFDYPTEDDRREHEAVRAAARFVKEHAECFPGGVTPDNPAQVALLAIKVYEVFLTDEDGSGAQGRASSDPEIAAAVVETNEEFEAGREAGQK